MISNNDDSNVIVSYNRMFTRMFELCNKIA